jgi:hypothetical protein
MIASSTPERHECDFRFSCLGQHETGDCFSVLPQGFERPSQLLLHDGFGADTSVLQPEEEAPPPFRFLIPVREYSRVGLGTSPRRRETVCLRGTFPTEWPGSEQEVHAQVKHSGSITLLVQHAGQGRGTCHLPPMRRTVKPKQRAGFGMLSCGRVQMQASD